MSSLLHKQVEATATPTIEKGSAVLLVAAYSKDRGQDVIQRGAFASTRQAWVDSGKQIPLALLQAVGDQPEDEQEIKNFIFNEYLQWKRTGMNRKPVNMDLLRRKYSVEVTMKPLYDRISQPLNPLKGTS